MKVFCFKKNWIGKIMNTIQKKTAFENFPSESASRSSTTIYVYVGVVVFPTTSVFGCFYNKASMGRASLRDISFEVNCEVY